MLLKTIEDEIHVFLSLYKFNSTVLNLYNLLTKLKKKKDHNKNNKLLVKYLKKCQKSGVPQKIKLKPLINIKRVFTSI